MIVDIAFSWFYLEVENGDRGVLGHVDGIDHDVLATRLWGILKDARMLLACLLAGLSTAVVRQKDLSSPQRKPDEPILRLHWIITYMSCNALADTGMISVCLAGRRNILMKSFVQGASCRQRFKRDSFPWL